MSRRRTVYLVRHAATGLEHVWLGQRDTPLSDAGRRQAERLAAALRDSGADALFSSDLVRARETAAPLVRALNLTPMLVSGLRERHFGTWEGLTWEEISRRFPSEADAYVNDWLHVAPPGGEPVDAMRHRVLAAWADIASAAWSRAIVVGHGGSNRMLLAEFLGMPLAHLFRIDQDVAALNRIELVDGVPCIGELNRALTPPDDLP